MIDSIDCLPCLSRQAATTARLSTSNTAKQQAGMGEALMHLAMMEPSTPPTLVGEDLQRTLSRHTGNSDPYAEIRQRLTVAARALLPALLRMKQESEDPWEFALRVCAAGNLLEAAREPNQAGPAMDAAWQAAARGTLVIDHSSALRFAANQAGEILFLADNAGEVVWDRLLIDLLGAARVSLAVRHQPYLHKAIVRDLDFATWLVPPRVAIYDDPPPGHPGDHTVQSLDQLLAKSDLVITKGSEWPERLAGRMSPEKCFFILAPACPRVAARFGVAHKALVVTQAFELPPRPPTP